MDKWRYQFTCLGFNNIYWNTKQLEARYIFDAPLKDFPIQVQPYIIRIRRSDKKEISYELVNMIHKLIAHYRTKH